MIKVMMKKLMKVSCYKCLINLKYRNKVILQQYLIRNLQVKKVLRKNTLKIPQNLNKN